MTYDVIVVGASFAGLSAAMQLARARKAVLLVDAGEPRNRFAEASHGFLGQDGVAPAAIMREGLRQLSAYPTVDFVHGRAAQARGARGDFTIVLETGAEAAGRRLILATGVRDELPPIPGLREGWGRTVLHCPYCHGYEVGGRAVAVLANNPHAARQAAMVSDWGPTTFFTQGGGLDDPEMTSLLKARGVVVEDTPVVGLEGDGADLAAVRLADGRRVAVAAIFTAPRTHMASALAEQLGCAFVDGPTGPYIRVDEVKQTSVPGVFAAGDAAQPMHNATLASAAGVMAGVGAHHSLIF